MSENAGGLPRRHREGIFGAISAGVFFLLVGIIFVITPNLFQLTVDFLTDGFHLVNIPHTEISTFAPISPLSPDNRIIYRAFEQFSFAFGVFQLVLLALRFVAGSPWSKKAETASNFVGWVGTGYLTLIVLLQPTRWSALTTWFVFWAGILMVLGLSLIVRAIILAAVYSTRALR